jgi:hypothetical protein
MPSSFSLPTDTHGQDGGSRFFDELEFKALGVDQFAHADWDGFPVGQFRSAVAPRAGNKFVDSRFGVREWTDEDGLQNAMQLDVGGKFSKVRFIEGTPRVGLRLRMRSSGMSRTAVMRFSCVTIFSVVIFDFSFPVFFESIFFRKQDRRVVP